MIRTKQKRAAAAAREQRNKYKQRTEARTTPSNQTRRQAGGFNSPFHPIYHPLNNKTAALYCINKFTNYVIECTDDSRMPKHKIVRCG